MRYKYSDNKSNTIHKIWPGGGDGDVQSTDGVRGLSFVEYSNFETLRNCRKMKKRTILLKLNSQCSGVSVHEQIKLKYDYKRNCFYS